MISPELLRRYQCFGFFNEAELSAIAQIAQEGYAEPETVLFEEGGPVDYLYLLVDGCIDLYTTLKGSASRSQNSTEIVYGEINPGELFCISALVEPYCTTASGKATKLSHFILINAVELRKLYDANPRMGYIGLRHIAQALAERLAYTRFQLAAAGT